MNQLDAALIYWSLRSAQHVSGNILPIIRSVRLRLYLIDDARTNKNKNHEGLVESDHDVNSWIADIRMLPEFPTVRLVWSTLM